MSTQPKTHKTPRRRRKTADAIIETFPDGYYEVNREGILETANNALAHILGCTREELIGTHLTRHIEAPARAGMQALLMEVEHSGAAVKAREFPALTKTGVPCIIDLSAAPLRDVQGEIIGICGIVRDVTTRSEIEAVLRESEEKYRSLMAAMGGGVVLQDAEGHITTYNEPARRILGLTDQMLDTSPEEWSQYIVDDFGKPMSVDQLPPMIVLRTGQAQLNMVLGLKDEEGTVTRWLLVNSKPIFRHEDDKKPSAVVSTFSDITQSKRTEQNALKRAEQLTLLQMVNVQLTRSLSMEHVVRVALDTAVRLSGANTGFLALSDNDVMYVARAVGAYAALTGTEGKRLLLSKTGVVGRVLREGKAEYIPKVEADSEYLPQVKATRAQIALPLIAGDTTIGVLNLETNRPERYNEEVFEFLKVLAGRIAAAIENARLYEEKHQQLDELRHIHQQLSELEQLKTQMIRVASHDLRSPLGILKAYLVLLQEDLGAGKAPFEMYFQAMERAISRMEQMTTDILSLERIHAAQTREWEPVNLCALVEQVYNDHHSSSLQKRLVYDLTLPEEKITIRGEPVQLYEAIANLIINAIKYTPTGGRVLVSLEQEKSTVAFRVRDTGIGVPEEFQAKLFQPFYRVKTTETQAIDGTGLGLYLVKQIVTRHGGKMIFESIHGEGSVFGFELSLLIH